MKVLLMHPRENFDPGQPLPENSDDLVADLGLERLFVTMAAGDKLAYSVAKAAVLSPLDDVDAIIWRQHVLADCIAAPEVPQQLYSLANEALEAHRKLTFWGLSRSPEALRYYSVQALEVLLGYLAKLQRFAGQHASQVGSPGLSQFLSMLRKELDEAYLAELNAHLAELKLHGGLLMSAALGPANRGVDYMLHREPRLRLRQRLGARRAPSLSFVVPERDEAGLRSLAELQERGVNIAANALAQSVDHVLSFLESMRTELAFYLGCLNLRSALKSKGEPTCTPELLRLGEAGFAATGLYDPCLSLALQGRAVGNDLEARGKVLVVVTGANRGGKSTFLRSVTTAQLMAQTGMFVAASSFATAPAPRVFSFFKRDEVTDMRAGKLDEELSRLSRIISAVSAGCVLACNEPFASTNEREGSDIGRAVFLPLADAGVRTFVVTHMFDLADSLYRAARPDFLFLRAPRQVGAAPFRLVEGAPEATAYADDVYKNIFGEDLEPATPRTAGAPSAAKSSFNTQN
jgi:hypothetical protein